LACLEEAIRALGFQWVTRCRSPEKSGGGGSQPLNRKIEENGWPHFEGAGDLDDIIESEIGLSPFEFPNGIAVPAHHFGELFLGYALFFPHGPEPFPE
jgi:hypothetical protein